MLSRTLRAVLLPLSVLYEGAARVRAGLYSQGIFRSRRLGGVVISVGNLTVGGTGKTPMVLWLAEKLAAEGQQPAILTRGYGGKGQIDDRGLPFSDEVALLRERLDGRAQLGVGKDRYASGHTLEKHGVRWFILDDGFQHLALQRDVDIVLLDSTNPFGDRALLPAGRLREPRTALARAGIVVLTRTQRAPALETIVRRYTVAPIFYAWAELEAILRAPARMIELPEADWKSTKFFAFAGIGNPAAFLDDLRRREFSIVGQRSFRDHHRYTQADVEALDHSGVEAGADALLCTEKDVFNLRDTVPTRLPIYACRIRMAVSDPDGFWNAVRAEIRRKRPELTA